VRPPNFNRESGPVGRFSGAHPTANSARNALFPGSKIEAARSGDLAYEQGTFEESFKDGDGKPVHVVGKYVVVWKKQSNGQWKAIVDIFNTDR
jgi:ketosteroid isomerase-like protein